MTHSDEILQRLLALHPKSIDLTLDRVNQLLQKLSNPHLTLPPVVHIAGTNGKGSTHAFCAAIAASAGLSYHRYSSPHLVRFHERIVLNGSVIPEDALSLLLQECEEIQAGQPITFFEITTAAAFLAFSRNPADILFLETGLGGRLDATNIIPRPAAVQLSRIGLDHQEFLGNTVQKITKEKVAIARADTPLIVGAQPDEARDTILAHVDTHNIPCQMLHRDYEYHIQSTGDWIWQNAEVEISLPAPSLRGKHQYENAALAVATMRILSHTFSISSQHLEAGIANARWAGRMQLLGEGYFTQFLKKDTRLWIDGGHNLDAGFVLAECLQDLDTPRLIIGMLENKDCAGFLRCVAPYLHGAQSLTIPNSESTLLAENIAELHPAISPSQNFTQALKTAVASGGKNIVLCGSLYLIGAFLSVHQKQT